MLLCLKEILHCLISKLFLGLHCQQYIRKMTIFLSWKVYIESESKQKLLISCFKENEHLLNISLLQDIYAKKMWKGVPIRLISSKIFYCVF